MGAARRLSRFVVSSRLSSGSLSFSLSLSLSLVWGHYWDKFSFVEDDTARWLSAVQTFTDLEDSLGGESSDVVYMGAFVGDGFECVIVKVGQIFFSKSEGKGLLSL